MDDTKWYLKRTVLIILAIAGFVTSRIWYNQDLLAQQYTQLERRQDNVEKFIEKQSVYNESLLKILNAEEERKKEIERRERERREREGNQLGR